MAGRPRLYANAAEKTRAYRERQQQHISELDKWAEQAVNDMTRLRRSVIVAQGRGDTIALSLRTNNLTDLMEDLASYFHSGVDEHQKLKPLDQGLQQASKPRPKKETPRNKEELLP